MVVMMMMFLAAIHDRYLPDSQLLQRLHHRIHHGNHLYTDVGLVDSDSVLQVVSTNFSAITFSAQLSCLQSSCANHTGFLNGVCTCVCRCFGKRNTCTLHRDL